MIRASSGVVFLSLLLGQFSLAQSPPAPQSPEETPAAAPSASGPASEESGAEESLDERKSGWSGRTGLCRRRQPKSEIQRKFQSTSRYGNRRADPGKPDEASEPTRRGQAATRLVQGIRGR